MKVKTPKEVTPVEIDKEAWDQLESVGTRTNLVKQAFDKFLEQPTLVLDVMRETLKEEPTRKVIKSSVTLETSQKNEIENLAKRLVTTRNNLFNLAIKGILNGIIRIQ